jgi:hypothetical protein
VCKSAGACIIRLAALLAATIMIRVFLGHPAGFYLANVLDCALRFCCHLCLLCPPLHGRLPKKINTARKCAFKSMQSWRVVLGAFLLMVPGLLTLLPAIQNSPGSILMQLRELGTSGKLLTAGILIWAGVAALNLVGSTAAAIFMDGSG